MYGDNREIIALGPDMVEIIELGIKIGQKRRQFVESKMDFLVVMWYSYCSRQMKIGTEGWLRPGGRI